ncbi:MAG: carbohydrate kinase [Xenococcaceae cyanobacterium MO_167.B27]|nr:carbohydrate kinase [Xenococcaceae cyanobacterium MO_167.B27]
MSIPSSVICLGEILFDCLANEVTPYWEKVKSWTAFAGGAPANVASALVKLGTSAAFIGCVGQDPEGDKLLKELETVGVELTGVQLTSKFPTRQVYVLHSADGDRQFAGFGGKSPDAFADAYLKKEKLPTELFLEAEYLVIGTLELAYPDTRDAVFQALELAEKYYLKTVLDLNRRSQFWLNEGDALPLIQQLWQYIDFVKLSHEEALWLFDTTDAAKISYRLNSVEGVFVTNGAATVNYCCNDYQGTVNPVVVEVKDTTGAGDGFVAGLIHQLSRHGISSLTNPDIVQHIVTYACAVGSLTTTQSGAIAAQPTAIEIDNFLKQHQF